MKKVANIQTKDYIIKAIRNEILSGHMEAGEELLQEELAGMLGVSRMPVREALQTLVQEGFVERLPNRHMRVIALDQNQIREVFRIVAAMEYELVLLLLDKDGLIPLVDTVFRRTEAIDSKEALISLELEFHQSLAGLLQNKYLEQIYDKIMCGYVTFAIENLGKTEEKLYNLVSLCRALRERDAAELKERWNQYYEYYMQKFE
ncbi:MAG: GntR family transcriptional regulator [Lachnospiraceae bacterium]